MGEAEAPVDAVRSRGRRVDLLLALGLLLLVAPLVQEYSGYPGVRYALSVAVADHGTLAVDRYVPFIGIDRAEYGGHVYDHAAPYQSLVAAAPVAVWRRAGGSDFPTTAGRYAAHLGDLDDPGALVRGMWWATIWTSLLPGIGLAIVLRRFVARHHPDVATPVALALVLGTVILPFTSVFFGHVPAALVVLGAWVLLRDDDRTVAQTAVAGLLLGIGIGTEYTVAIPAAAMLLVVLLARRWQHVLALAVSTVAGTIPLLLYDQALFGNPFETAYQGHLPYFHGAGAGGVYNLQSPQPHELVRTLIGDRGLLTLTPIMVIALLGCWWAWRGQRPERRDAAVALGSLLVLLIASTGIDGYGGASAGPRYLIIVIPLFALPLAVAWQRVPTAATVTAVFGAVTMVTATLTGPLRGPGPPLSGWYRDLLHGHWAANAVTGHDHVWLTMASAVVGLGLLAVALRTPAEASPSAP